MRHYVSLLLVGLFAIFNAQAAPEIPPGYERQELSPTGGSIAIPHGWHYREQHGRNYLLWTLSREDSSQGSYDTGVRIQAFIEVTKRVGITPEAVIRRIIDSRHEVGQVISGDCQEQRQGDFTRICLESIEAIGEGERRRDYHVRYSFFWSEERDMAVVMTAGTPVEMWPRFLPVFDVMSGFTLIDPDRMHEQHQP